MYSLESPGAILMSSHNVQFHDKIRKFPEIFVFLSYRRNFKGTQKTSHGNEPSVFELFRCECNNIESMVRIWCQ